MNYYLDFIRTLSLATSSRLSGISAIYNFEYGDEFEITLCLLLSEILPQKFGVCRGHIVSPSGMTAGDDIIIYNKLSYPKLRPTGKQEFLQKEWIPLEAVYATIECKHTIDTQDTLHKAIRQSRESKSLLLSRTSLSNPGYEKDGPVYNGKVRDWPRNEPKFRNQPFCVVASRYYKLEKFPRLEIDAHTPDLLILGDSHIANQSINLGCDGIKSALFFDSDYWAPIALSEVDNCAFGLGLVTLLQALEFIHLLPVDWFSVLNEAYWNPTVRARLM